MLLGPEIGMREYADARLFGTFGVPLKLHIPRLPTHPPLLRPASHPIVDHIWLGVQALIALHILFPGTQILTSHHANLPTYAEIFGWVLSSFAFRRVLCTHSSSTVRLLREKGWANMRLVGRGVDGGVFSVLSFLTGAFLAESPLYALPCPLFFAFYLPLFLLLLPPTPFYRISIDGFDADAFLAAFRPTAPHPCAPREVPPPPASSSSRSTA
ncbi:hypothetical protein B0H13DRAFT_2318311 [Mycena leptocephala]|nr:hypothetical protein B0H13DRAFT_2318311 [Mycena leptocephala]